MLAFFFALYPPFLIAFLLAFLISTFLSPLQPSLDIFEAFDELLLLKQGGVCVYFGPLGWESANLIASFSAIPGVQPIMAG